MRIGVVCSYMLPHLGGLEIVADRLVDGFRARGHDVRCVTSHVPVDPPAWDGVKRRVATWNVAYERLGLPLPLWGRGGLDALVDLVRWADVVQGHGVLYPSSLLALAAARAARRPAALVQHIAPGRYGSAKVQAASQLGWATVGRASLRLATERIAVTPPAARFLQDAGLRHHVIHNGADTDRFSPAEPAQRAAAREALGVPPDGPLLVMVGRLVERKGLEVLLRLLDSMAPWRALLVGDGPRRVEVPEHPRLTWCPRVEPDAMPAVYAAADAVLFPARGEGLPLVVQEGMATGLPVLLHPDEVFAGPLVAAGVVCPVRDDADVLRALASLDPDHREAIGRAARAFAVATWSWDRTVDGHLEVLRHARVGGRT